MKKHTPRPQTASTATLDSKQLSNVLGGAASEGRNPRTGQPIRIPA